jgi:predicted nucleotidyltransferase
MTTETDFLRANAYHEGGPAIVAWALDVRVHEVAIRDDRPGEHTKTVGSGEERLPLIDRVALHNAGRQSEEMFNHLLPSWASDGDRIDTLNLLAAKDIRDTAEAERSIADGCARAREILRKHEHQVHRLAARLIECRRMSADDFDRFMKGVDMRAWASANESVRELWLFGSRATGQSRPDSDVDLAVALMPPKGKHDWALGNFVAFDSEWKRQLEEIVGRHVSLEPLVPGEGADAMVRESGCCLWSRQT